MPSSWTKVSRCPGGFVDEGELDAAVQVAGRLEPLAQLRRVELDAREDRRVGMEPHGGAGAARRPGLDDGALRLALLEALLPRVAVAPDGGDQLLRERVDDAGADAVQAARGLVVLALELAAGVEHREDDLEGALAGLGMLVDRDAAAVVGDGERRVVLVQRDDDRRRVAVHRLVDGVVEDLPGQVVQAVACRPRRCTCRDACGRARAPRGP